MLLLLLVLLLLLLLLVVTANPASFTRKRLTILDSMGNRELRPPLALKAWYSGGFGAKEQLRRTSSNFHLRRLNCLRLLSGPQAAQLLSAE